MVDGGRGSVETEWAGSLDSTWRRSRQVHTCIDVLSVTSFLGSSCSVHLALN